VIDLSRMRKKPIVPMSSMSDIGFLLLIFIMLISLINQRHEVPIKYPEAEVIEKTQEKDNLEIWVDAAGTVSVEGHVMDATTLESVIAGTLAEKPETRVHVIADRDTPYRDVDKIVKILQRLQHRVVSFVVKEAL